MMSPKLWEFFPLRLKRGRGIVGVDADFPSGGGHVGSIKWGG